MNDINRCENCKHYVRHYYWRGDRLKKSFSGHCVAYRNVKLVKYNNGCKKWEVGNGERENEEFKVNLRHTAKQINDIAAILKADK